MTTKSDTTTTTEKLDAETTLDSLTGFDELAIETTFGGTPTDLDGTKFLRALLFATQRHAGKSDPDARKYALGLTIKQISDMFVPADEADPDLPGSEAGKDET